MTVPSDPPKITRVDVLGATSLQVEFIPPAVNYHNGILRGFKVAYIVVCRNWNYTRIRFANV